MDETRMRDYHALFTDAWRLFKRHIQRVDSDESWRAAMGEAGGLASRYKAKGMGRQANRLAMAVLDALEDEYRGRMDEKHDEG